MFIYHWNLFSNLIAKFLVWLDPEEKQISVGEKNRQDKIFFTVVQVMYISCKINSGMFHFVRGKHLLLYLPIPGNRMGWYMPQV